MCIEVGKVEQCPHCSSNIGRRVQLKGFDVLTAASIMHERERDPPPPPPPPPPLQSDSDSDFETPRRSATMDLSNSANWPSS